MHRRILNITFILILQILVFSVLSFSQETAQTLTVRGRVVDENGNPVAKALVAMSNRKPPKGSVDWLILGDRADENGRFEISTYTSATKINTYLFVSSPDFTEALSPIDAPFTILHERNLLSRGQPITLEKDKDLEVGDIKVQVWFGLVEIFISGKDNQPFYKNRDDWSDFIYLVRNEKGKLAAGTGLSIDNLNRVIKYEKGSIFVALPEGRWFIEILQNWEDLDKKDDRSKNKILARSEIFEVKKGNNPLPVKIIINK